MTTRRDILTGLAAVPVLPVLPASATTDAQPVAAVPTASIPPFFADNLDRQLWNELHLLETALARVKDRLLAANNAHPLVRSGVLFDMRCSFTTLHAATDWARMLVEEQRQEANAAASAWKAQNEATT